MRAALPLASANRDIARTFSRQRTYLPNCPPQRRFAAGAVPRITMRCEIEESAHGARLLPPLGHLIALAHVTNSSGKAEKSERRLGERVQALGQTVQLPLFSES